MKNVALVFVDPAHNLACDEAILRICEQERAADVLRIWEPENYFVVLGYSNRVETEINIAACRENGIPILRRFTGGGAVIQGPGCLNYTVVLKTTPAATVNIRESYERVLSVHRRIFQSLTAAPVEMQGISDLTVAGRKFSGNSQHRSTAYVLVHGTFLLSFDIKVIERLLRMPSRQPDYRHNRSHTSFLTNFQIPPDAIRDRLLDAWNADEAVTQVPLETIERLVVERYSRPEWNWKF